MKNKLWSFFQAGLFSVILLLILSEASVVFGQNLGQNLDQNLSQFDQAILTRISQKIDEIETIESNFVQIGPDGSERKGKFYLKRPGLMRFDYSDDSKQKVIVNGYWMVFVDEKSGLQERYPVDSTPLGALLTEKVDLATSNYVVAQKQIGDALHILLRDQAQPEQGSVLAVIGVGDGVLRAWNVTDEQGLITYVRLDDIVLNKKLSRSLFRVDVVDRRRRGER